MVSAPIAALPNPQDIMDRSAEISPKAESSVLLAITRAGVRLVAVGEQGRILVSDDNGHQWRQVPVPTSVTLTSVYFPSAQQGWAVGHSGVILHSTDGGSTWQRQLEGIQAARLNSEAVKALGSAYEGVDALQRNAAQFLTDGADKPFLDVFFQDEAKGWVIGAYGLAFRTDDGGKNWHSIIPSVTNPKARHLYSIRQVGTRRYIVGEQGTMLVSEGEQRFNALKSPYNGTYFGLVAGPHRELVLFGLRGNVFWSGNEGKDWKKVDMGQSVTVTAGIRLDSGQLLLADESGRLLRSEDDGQSFKPISVPKPSYVTGIAQAADGAIILSGARGIVRIAPTTVQKDAK